MSPEAIKALLNRRPFMPFRLHISEITSYEIRNPELVLVGASVTFIGIIRNVQSDFFDEPVLVANRHITRVEPIVEVPATN